MDRFTSCSAQERRSFIDELQTIGCCDLCVLRYLGVSQPHVYRDTDLIRKIITGDGDGNGVTASGDSEDVETSVSALKIQKLNTCVACVGLLQNGIQVDWLDRIAAEIKKSDVETTSYCPALSIPICLQIRAYSIWYHMKKKFQDFLNPIDDLKPEGMSLKAAWKWICTDELKAKVDPASDWTISGALSVQINPEYDAETEECKQLDKYLFKRKKGKRNKNGCNELVTRGAVEATFRHMGWEEFSLNFQCPPVIPSTSVRFGSIVCVHAAIFVAGRYCKFSRKLSQTPWILDNVRKTDSSVEEEISNQLLPFFKASDSRFSSSGREDVDVRTLGKGRPFAFEILNPKRTVFSASKMKEIQDKINSSTTKVSVRDLQIVDKKDLGTLKHGEESKTKTYCALCNTPGASITSQQIDILNSQKLPIVLKQKTPVRVLHRRSLATRERSILEIEAKPVESHPETFILRLKTQAGTYIKEFVHGDFGRTTPNVAEILGTDADILALDVVEVDLDWPEELE